MNASLFVSPAMVVIFAMAAASLPVEVTASSADVPQWRGPNRDGIFPGSGLLQQWPATGPKLAWKAEKLGKGMAGVSIAGGKIFTMAGRRDGQYLVALDVNSQKELWAAKVSAKGGEPRCTPTIDNDLAFVVSSHGDLAAVRVADGSVVWKKNYSTDFGGAPTPTWQFSESPLVDGANLIVIPGSADALMAALDKKTGAVLWQCAQDLSGKGHGGAGYTGAMVSEAAGIRQYVTLVGKGAIGVEAKSGKLLWHYNRVANGTAVIPTPLVWDDYVFVSSGYGTGAALLRIVPSQEPAAAEAAPKVDAERVAALSRKLAGLNTEISKRRDARAKFERGTEDYEAADRQVQALKPDLERAESELRTARGERGGSAPAALPGSPVMVKEMYWLNAGVFQNHHGGMLRIGDYIYAGKGHNNGFPICLEWKTGKVVWEKGRGPGKESAAVIAADGHLYFRYQDGTMALIEASPKGYVEKGAFKLASVNGPSWPHPAIHDGKLYLRDQDVLLCYELK
jgi:outer membrane protein assembly factor BamB